MDTGVYTSWYSYLAKWLMVVAPVAHHGSLLCTCACVFLYLSVSLCPSPSFCMSKSVTVCRGYPTSWQFDLGKEIRFWRWLSKTNVVFAPLLTLFVEMCMCASASLTACAIVHLQCVKNCMYLYWCACAHVCGSAWPKDVLVECYRVVSAACSLSP